MLLCFPCPQRKALWDYKKYNLSLAVHTDRHLHLAPTLRLEPSATFPLANNTRGNHFLFGPVAGAAAVTAFRLAQIETCVQIALQQLATLATITIGNHCHNDNGFALALPPHLALLSLLNRPQVSSVGFNVSTNRKTYRNKSLSAAMYHQHSQQQGPPPFSSGPRPPHHQQPPNPHQNRPPSNMLSPVMGFQFPRPTQLPDELESALAIRGARDVDHRHIDHMNQPNQHQNQGSASGISQHGSYGSNPMTLSSDNQSGQQQGVDWSSYQPPTKLFASPPPSAGHQSQRQQGPQQQPQSSHAGTSIPSWAATVSDSPSPQARHPNAGGSGGSGDGPALYTPESAGSILASFGLSNEDLEVLSHYPDDQLTPDTLPFILRDIQINKTGNQKTVASTSSSSFPRSVRDMPLPPSRSSPLKRSRSPEVPSLLTVTQTAGKVIDYGHASRAKAETGTRETFKRERLSNDRTVKMYPSSSFSSSAPKLEKTERRQVRLEHNESSKHGDRDYRRTGSDHRKSSRSPGREFARSSKSRNLDRDYRRDAPKPRPPSEAKSEASSRRSLSSSSGSRPRVSSKKLPTPTMISDFSAVSPKVYPHTCSLCHSQCDQEKDWVDHVNTVNHTAACRDLRNKYPGWKPYLPSRSGRYGSRALWDPMAHSPSHSVSRSLSGSRTPSPPPSKHRVGPRPHRANKGPFSPHNQARLQYYKEHPPQRGVKRPHEDFNKFSPGAGQHPPSSKAGYSSKHGPLQTPAKTGKSGTKPGTKPTKTSAKVPPAKRKKKTVPPASQDPFDANRLVYLTGIPKDASEQDVTDLVGSFGKINNVILMACSEEERHNGEGQKASVCMVKADCALTLANSTNLSIRGQQISASIAKKTKAGPSLDTTNSKPAPVQDNADPEGESGIKTRNCESATPADKIGEADQKTSDESMVLITGLPESGWTESDILQLVQTFGTPSDVITATQIGKVLVSVPDMEVAQEMVKVHTSKPARIQDRELKMTHLRPRVGLNTPVALYNLLMGSLDPLESSVAVGWSSLLVISNVPSTPSGPAEVQKLVRRFGTVIKTLELNNMVICEMATAAMALSVYKRFQKFPCIIHNNPLFFSRKPDPKVNTQTKVVPASLDSAEDITATGTGSQAADKDKDTTHTESSDSPLEGIKKEGDSKDAKLQSTDETVGEDEALKENRSQDEDMKKDPLTVAASDSLAAPQTEADLETHLRERSDVETVLETVEENKGVDNETHADEETKTKTSSSDGEAAFQEAAMPEHPEVTQEMVNALLVECRTRTVGPAAPSNGGHGETHMETERSNKAAEETKEQAKSHTEDHLKKKDRELKEKAARKEKEARDKQRREKERRDWEKKERTRREREQNEKARRDREEERREREWRERKRAYSEGLSGSRPSSWSEGHKQSSWSDGQCNNTEAETEMVDEEFDDFPFNLSDFVTVDEVGDVNDLPSSTSPSVPMETAEGGEDAPTSVQQESPGVMPTAVSTETCVSDVPAPLVTGDEPVTVSTAVTSDVFQSSDLIAAASTDAALGDASREDASQGNASQGDTSQGDASQGDASRGDASQADASQADASQADASQADASQGDASQGDASQGDASQADTSQAGASQADASQAGASQADASQADASQAGASQADASQADASQAGASQAGASQAGAPTSRTPAPTCPPKAPETTPLIEAALTAILDSTTEVEPAAPAGASNSPAGVVTSQRESGENGLQHNQATTEDMAFDKTEEGENKRDVKTEAPSVDIGKHERSEDPDTNTEEAVQRLLTAHSLPPFNPSSPVGLEYLVPKTGFFCKVCNRFFTGAKEAERNHCKTLKHYENLQKYLKTLELADVSVNPDTA
uniref:zinc finger protein 638-like isoform X2 n=1 Tax=Gasterosteus aculeatus aculeatus TaxID=481459 RepID=UPI001A991A1A|nr:zinc finger protein 638-like isoform X2 [Gasterosteus aculeatus aculeatus]